MTAFTDRVFKDLIRVIDEHLDMIYDEYAEAEDTERQFMRRLATLYYAFTGVDWQSKDGIAFTKEGRQIEVI